MKQIIFVLITTVLVFVTSVWAGGDNSVVANHPSDEKKCACFNNDCGCCEYLTFKEVGINGTVCTNFTYLAEDVGISITLTWNNYTVVNETVSARNPPPICFGIPEIEKLQAHVCMRFYDLTFGRDHFHGCIRLSISIYHVIRKSINVGCVNIPMEMLIDAYSTKNRELLISIREELKKLEHSNNVIPSVKII